MEPGTWNEINAQGTPIGKVLPALAPDCVFHEEGCLVIESDKYSFLVVSPDGSIRDKDGIVKFAVELKCPVPGKTISV